MRVRDIIVDSQHSIGGRARRRRWRMFHQWFPDLDRMSVVDLGGRADTWTRAPVRPKHVTIANIGDFADDPPSWVDQQHGDACDLPAAVTDRSYDLVFSNSLVEHVGGHSRRRLFADAVHGLAGRHWVQTPYRYFPVEPHWLFPGFQFLPAAAQARLAVWWPLVHTRPGGYEGALRSVLSVELVGRAEMRLLFPGSMIVGERFGPLTKSLIAVKT